MQLTGGDRVDHGHNPVPVGRASQSETEVLMANVVRRNHDVKPQELLALHRQPSPGHGLWSLLVQSATRVRVNRTLLHRDGEYGHVVLPSNATAIPFAHASICSQSRASRSAAFTRATIQRSNRLSWSRSSAPPNITVSLGRMRSTI